jgi:hypothetical protein
MSSVLIWLRGLSANVWPPGRTNAAILARRYSLSRGLTSWYPRRSFQMSANARNVSAGTAAGAGVCRNVPATIAARMRSASSSAVETPPYGDLARRISFCATGNGPCGSRLVWLCCLQRVRALPCPRKGLRLPEPVGTTHRVDELFSARASGHRAYRLTQSRSQERSSS